MTESANHAPTVKPLEWVKHPTAEAWRCDTFLGTYQVWVGSIGTGWQFDGVVDRLNTPAKDARTAKAAAQSHCERLILSVFDPSAFEAQAHLIEKFAAYLEGQDPATCSGGHRNSDLRTALAQARKGVE